jgi:hypothetical protein
MNRRVSTRWIPVFALGAVLLSLTVNSAVWLERAMSGLLIATVLSAHAPVAVATRPADPTVVKTAEEFRNAVLAGDAGRRRRRRVAQPSSAATGSCSPGQ